MNTNTPKSGWCGRPWRAWLLAALLVPQLHAGERTVDDLKVTAAGRPLGGRRPATLFSKDYLRLLVEDTQDTLTAPLRWDRRDLGLAGGLGAVLAGSAFFDNQIRVESQENRTKQLDAATRQIQRFGAEYSFLLLGGFEAYGRWADDPRAREVAMDGVTASIIAAGIVTPVLKFSVGRIRPYTAARTFEFKPFGKGESFPSGHTTQVFAVASVVAAHYPEWWVKGLAYGVAGMVGYSRIEQNAHFASDVVAAAIIGTAVGIHVVKLHDRPKETVNRVSIAPFLSGRTGGLVLQRQF